MGIYSSEALEDFFQELGSLVVCLAILNVWLNYWIACLNAYAYVYLHSPLIMACAFYQDVYMVVMSVEFFKLLTGTATKVSHICNLYMHVWLLKMLTKNLLLAPHIFICKSWPLLLFFTSAVFTCNWLRMISIFPIHQGLLLWLLLNSSW